MSDSWSNYRVTCHCSYTFIATIPSVHSAQLECPECHRYAVPYKCELLEIYRVSGVEKVEDKVDHPAYYNLGRFEVIDVIEDWELGFHLGNAVKYIARAGRKDVETRADDLKKAIWYLQREVERTDFPLPEGSKE